MDLHHGSTLTLSPEKNIDIQLHQAFTKEIRTVTEVWTPGLNGPFPSCLLPLFQNESWWTTFRMEMSLNCKTINVQVKLICSEMAY